MRRILFLVAAAAALFFSCSSDPKTPAPPSGFETGGVSNGGSGGTGVGGKYDNTPPITLGEWEEKAEGRLDG